MAQNIIGDNFYITAVNQNGRWLIDEIETTEAPDDPVNFSEDEMLQFIESNNLTYLGKVVMNATIAYDYSTYYIDQQIKEIKENTVVFLVEGDFTDGVDGITATSGNVIYDIPDELIPLAEK